MSGVNNDLPPTSLTHAECLELWREAMRRGHLLCSLQEPDGTRKWALLYRRKRKPTPFESLEQLRAALFSH